MIWTVSARVRVEGSTEWQHVTVPVSAGTREAVWPQAIQALHALVCGPDKVLDITDIRYAEPRIKIADGGVEA